MEPTQKTYGEQQNNTRKKSQAVQIRALKVQRVSKKIIWSVQCFVIFARMWRELYCMKFLCVHLFLIMLSFSDATTKREIGF